MIRLSDVKVRLQYRWRVRQRLMVLHFARVHGPTAAGRRFGVSVRTIRRWRVRWRQNGLEGLGNPTPSTTGITGPLYQGPLPIVVDAGGHDRRIVHRGQDDHVGLRFARCQRVAPVAPRRSDVPELPEQRLQRLGQRQEHLHERRSPGVLLGRVSCSCADTTATAPWACPISTRWPTGPISSWPTTSTPEWAGKLRAPRSPGGHLCDLIFYIRMKSVRAMREELSRGVCSLP